jgi:hypothetical protein
MRLGLFTLVAVLVAACGDAPLQSLGQRTSDWLNEPTIVTTTTVPITVPLTVSSDTLKWFNDGLGEGDVDDPVALQQTIFERRGGDLFIQSSRAEIAIILPDVKFPSRVPYLAEYVTSQLVFDSSGELSDDPTVTLGIWSAEPYPRSRSVAQMVVLRVATDEEAAAELSEPGARNSCARFAERATQACEIVEIGGEPLWLLTANNGHTYIWFDGIYRYELFGRSFVPTTALEEIALNSTLLADLESASG